MRISYNFIIAYLMINAVIFSGCKSGSPDRDVKADYELIQQQAAKQPETIQGKLPPPQQGFYQEFKE